MPTLQEIETFRKKTRAKGYSEAQIQASIDRKIQAEALKKPVQGPQAPGLNPTTPKLPDPVAPVQEPMSWTGLAKNAGQDIADFTVNQPIQTAKTLKTLGKEAGRTAILKGAEVGSKKVVDQQLEVIKKLKKEKDPVKKQQLLQQSRQLSDQLERGGQALDKATNVSPQEQANLEAIPKSPVELGKGILKNIGRTFGLKQGSDGNIVFDPMEAVRSAYEKPVTTALLLKDVGTGIKKSVKSGVKDVAETSGKSGVVETFGKDVRRGVLNPQADASPFYAEDIRAIQKAQEKIGLSGSAENQLSLLPEAFKKSQAEIKSLLKDAKPPEKGILTSEFTKQIDNANYNISDPQFAKAVELETKILKELEGKSATAQYEQLSKYRDLLKSTRKKIDAGTTLLPKEEARLSAFNALKDTIDSVSPEVRAVNTLQNQMFNISEGLVKKSKEASKPFQLFGTDVPVPGRALQGVQDATGEFISNPKGTMGKIASPVTSRLPSLSTPTGLGLGMEASKDLSPGNNLRQPGQTGQENTNPIEQNNQGGGNQGDNQQGLKQISPSDQNNAPIISPDSVQTQSDIFQGKSKREVLTLAVQKGASPEDLKKISDLYDQVAPQQNEWKGMTTSELVKSRKDLADGGFDTYPVDKELATRGLKTSGTGATGKPKSASSLQIEGKANAGLDAIGRIEGLIKDDQELLLSSSVPMVEVLKGQKRKQYESAISSLTDAIGGLRTGASVSKDQQEFYKKMLPKAGDSPETINLKILAVKRELSGYLGQNVIDTPATQ